MGKHGKTVSVWSAAEVSLDDRKKAAEELVRRVVGEKSAQACAAPLLPLRAPFISSQRIMYFEARGEFPAKMIGESQLR